MSELIPLTNTDEGARAVMGRDLHQFLEVQSNYTTWMNRLVEKYDFVEGQDYLSKTGKVAREGRGNIGQLDHILTLDMAKELSMVQNNERGRQARRYFIECERRAQQPQPQLPKDYASALRELAESVEARELAEREAARSAKRLEMAAPKVAKADAHSNVDEWKTRQNFYREVQQWGDAQNLDIKQGNVSELLTRKGMFIGGLRQDRGQLTRSATKAKWGRNHKGVAENGHAYCTPQLSPRGQDIAWKWIVQAVEEHGEKLNPKKETK